MSRQTFLSVISEAGERDLFQYDNAVPLFWYCFFDKESFDVKIPEIKKLYKMSISDSDDEKDSYFSYVDENPGSADVMLSKETFRNNAQVSRAYIKGKYPEHATLYDDFIRYIDANMKDEDMLAISYFDNIYAYDDAAAFIKEISKTITAVKKADKSFTPELIGDEVFALTGMDRYLRYGFREKSPSYLEACKKEEQEAAAIAAEKAQSGRKGRIKYFSTNMGLMIIIGIGLIYAGTVLYKNDGFTLSTIMAFLIGIGSLLIGLKELKTYIEKKMGKQNKPEEEEDEDEKNK